MNKYENQIVGGLGGQEGVTLAGEYFDGSHVCLRRAQSSGTRGHSRRMTERDWRDRRDGGGFEIFETSNRELRTSDRGFRALESAS